MSELVELPQSVVLITGIPGSGKSSVAQALAERLTQSVHVRGDAFRRMIVNGRVDMTPEQTDEAVRQLRLRYQLAAGTADFYFDAGFTVILQDVVLGDELSGLIQTIQSRPLLLVVLAPRPEVVAARDAERGKKGYREWSVAELDKGLRVETPKIGLWLDTSDQSLEATVDEIIVRAWDEAVV